MQILAAAGRGVDRLDIVMSARNAAGTIEATLASIACQELLGSRVLVYNDASTDATSAAVIKWMPLLDITLVEGEEPVGPGIGRNRAAQEGTAEYITFVDADDLILPNHTRLHLASAERGSVLTASRIMEWYVLQDGRSVLRSSGIAVPALDKQWPDILTENFMPAASSVKRASFEAAGGFRANVMEDWDLWIRLLRSGHRARQIESATYLHRVLPGSRGTSLASYRLKDDVLDLAAEDCASHIEMRAVNRGRRHLSALKALDDSVRLGLEGRALASRLSAARGLASPKRRTRMAALARVAMPNR